MTTRAPQLLNRVDNLTIPGRHESRALIDCCPTDTCITPTEPTAVLDLPGGHGRVGAYVCRTCRERWLCSWEAA